MTGNVSAPHGAARAPAVQGCLFLPARLRRANVLIWPRLLALGLAGGSALLAVTRVWQAG